MVAATMWMAGGGIAQAQLLSPGPLTRAHQQLEGFTNCTSCHTIGGRGVDRVKCLSCHEPLRDRIEAETGYHAGVDERCESCHRDHLGLDFDIVKLDESSFDHRETGYELLGSHLEIECRTCHKPELITAADIRESKDGAGNLDKTFLGLPVECANCHAAVEPHDGQFGDTACSDCHSASKWPETVSFSHDRAKFQLTGLHASVSCASCHKPRPDEIIQYIGLEFSECSNCHTDPHKQAFGVTCQRCHTSEGWGNISVAGQQNFRHELTGFALLGAHSKVECADCHRIPARNDALISIAFKPFDDKKAFPGMESEFCGSCHVEFHRDEFDAAADKDCAECHTAGSWDPTTYGIDRHNLESSYPLTGSHEATPCASCHSSSGGPSHFRFEDTTCEGCHAKVNPHNSSFSGDNGTTNCAECHDTSAWTDQFFDHASTEFALVGKHATLLCKTCHTSEGYKLAERTCTSCHADRNPHGIQFETDCASCHDATGFVPLSPKFDHSISRLPLDGAHESVACLACHTKTADDSGKLFIQYIPTSPLCKDCHSDSP